MSSLITGNNSGELNGCIPSAPSAPSAQNVPNKQDILMRSLTDFFQDNNYIEEMLPIISGESKISLRIIDWFCY